MLKRGGLVTLLVLFLATLGYADILLLDNGGKLSGKVTGPENGKYKIESEIGTIWVDVARVVDRFEDKSLYERFTEKRAEVANDDVSGLWELVVWCRTNKAPRFVRGLCETILAADANHEGANLELGNHKLDGKWVDEETYYAAQGMVKHEGRWVTAAEKETLDAMAKAKTLEKEIAVEKRRRDRELKEIARREAYEEKLRQYKLAMARKYLERQRAQDERSTGYSDGYYGGYGGQYGDVPWWWLVNQGDVDLSGLGANPFLGGSGTTGTGSPSGVHPGVGTIPR